MDTEHKDLSFEDAEKMCKELFDDLKLKDGYTNEDCAKFSVSMGLMLDAYEKEYGDLSPEKMVELIEKPSNLSDEEIAKLPEFDIRAHYSNLIKNMNLDEKNLLLFENTGKNGSISYKYSQQLYFLLNQDKIMSGKEKEQEQCREILGKMIECEASTKSPNKELAELVEKCGGLDKVQFNIINEDGIDGHAGFSQKRADNGGSGIVINITKGAFENDFKGLPMLIGHELGHCLDFSQRPDEYPCTLKESEEYFADLAGNLLVSNANFTEKEKFEAKIAFMKDTKRHKDDLEQSRADIMNGYIKERHPQQYYGKYLQTLRGMGKVVTAPEKQARGNEPIKKTDILSKLRGKSSRE